MMPDCGSRRSWPGSWPLSGSMKWSLELEVELVLGTVLVPEAVPATGYILCEGVTGLLWDILRDFGVYLQWDLF